MTLAPASEEIAFDIDDIPFSTAGAWFNLSRVVRRGHVSRDVHLVSHRTGMEPVLELLPTVAGRRVEANVVATPALLKWQLDRGEIGAAYESARALRIRGQGADLTIAAAATKLTPFAGTYLFGDSLTGGYVFTSYETGLRYRVSPLGSTQLTAVGSQLLGDGLRAVTVSSATDAWEVAIEEYETGRMSYLGALAFDRVVADRAADFAEFVERVAPWRGGDTPAAGLACYVLWSSLVSPGGCLQRPSILMSMHWMDKVWSWDHCFNALAISQGDARLAWDQFLLPFDHQEPTGALPDSVAHFEVLYNFVKPPIHGWTLERLWRDVKHEIGPDELREALAALESWTEYWSRYRTSEASGLPQYQHGNDSGWDNATTFDDERVIESADLAAHLATQMRALAALQAECGRADSANAWDERAVALERRLLSELWATDRFMARGVESGIRRDSASLLDLMPIVLGPRLPREVRASLVRRLRQHLTPYGLATERPDSPHYRSDGYWRGPIWAPVTVLIEQGLRECGETEFATDIARRFLQLCESHGFAENFDAITGEGLRDRAYTWTASAYLLLAREHAQSF